MEQQRRTGWGAQTSRAGTHKQQGTSDRQHLQIRRTPRHSGIFQAIHRLDATVDPAARAELSAWVRDQYEVTYGNVPVGFVAECFLGPPFVDHRLDLLLSIVDHFTAAQAMPEPFAHGRMLARTGAYAFVEVYADGTVVPVKPDGLPVTDMGGPSL